jgi:hypothetical protein
VKNWFQSLPSNLPLVPLQHGGEEGAVAAAAGADDFTNVTVGLCTQVESSLPVQ